MASYTNNILLQVASVFPLLNITACYIGLSVWDLTQSAKFCVKQYSPLLCLWEINSPRLSYMNDTNIRDAILWRLLTLSKPKK